MEKISSWTDKKGVAHGNWCREKFCPTTCKYCGQFAMYFECSHGSKVYFHKIPSQDGQWDTNCPARNLSSNLNDWEIDLNKGSFNYQIDLSDEKDFDYKINLK